MVRLRLRRVGRNSQGSFRVVATDRENPRDGRFLEVVGFYNPRTMPATIQLQEDRIYHWLSKGAQPSDSVGQIFKSAGVMDRFERFKKGDKVETLVEEAKAAEAARKADPKTRRDVAAAAPTKKKAGIKGGKGKAAPKEAEPEAAEPEATAE